MWRWLVLLVLCFLLVGCEEDIRMELFVDENPCPKDNATLCHLYLVDGGIIYMNFSSNGTIEYRVGS